LDVHLEQNKRNDKDRYLPPAANFRGVFPSNIEPNIIKKM